MGKLVGHVIHGIAFLAFGLWHLFNHIKHVCLHPNTYTASSWFPISKIRYLELYLIMATSTIYTSFELFISPKEHTPFDQDGTIPSNHLHNFEHSSISIAFFCYAAMAIIFDKTNPRAQYGLTKLMEALVFAQLLFVLHFHSADHMGLEGQFHLLLQLVVFVSLITTFIGIGLPKSFLVSFVRSLSIAFQGLWLIVMAYMLWKPSLIPKDCFLHLEDGGQVVRCSSVDALRRAKSLANIEFSCFLVGITVFAMFLYLILNKFYSEKVEYSTLVTKEVEEMRMGDDVELQKRETSHLDEPRSFSHMDKLFSTIDMER